MKENVDQFEELLSGINEEEIKKLIYDYNRICVLFTELELKIFKEDLSKESIHTFLQMSFIKSCLILDLNPIDEIKKISDKNLDDLKSEIGTLKNY